MTLVGAILAILATAIGFTAFLIQARVPMMILEAMEGFITSQVMFLIALNVFLIGVGMLMDIFSAIVVVVPLIVPIAMKFGVDPYHLGIVFLLNLEIGYMTPPVGLNLFISSYRFEKPILHGLCTLGVAGRAILAEVCKYDPTRMKSLDLRFSSPVYPGETITTDIWEDGTTISFRARVKARDVVVLNNGKVTIDG